MSTIIGRVTRDIDRPRGPDAKLDVRVPEEWIRSGATVEVELPRNLVCAACDGGGCDTCQRSGAVTLRGRGDAPEVVEVTLPRMEEPDSGRRTAILLRIPEHGGLPDPGLEVPRGNLLLRVRLGSVADAGVARIRRSLAPAPGAHPEASVSTEAIPQPPRWWKVVVLAAAASVATYAFVRALLALLG